ncbi:MAG: hypothetical protein Q9216_002876, partial [Gyalolechia sp. 2 TL-2023]
MRRGSAVLLTILPLLSPAYGLPTYFGNDAGVAHANVERAALPEAAVNMDMNEKRGAEDAIADWENEAVPAPAWLPKSKRQTSNTGLSSGSVSLETGGTPEASSSDGSDAPAMPNTIANVGSEGPANWLRPIGRPIKERDLTAREAEAEPAVTMELGYIPPALNTGDMKLGAPPLYKRRTL